MNLGHVFEQGDAVLVSVFLLLIGMSVLSWYIIFWKLIRLKKERQHIAAFRAQQKAADWPLHIDDSKAEGAIKVLLAQAAHTRGVAAAYDSNARKELLSTHMAQGLDVIRTGMDKGLTVLASVGSSAPFIGLFGTVWGIYNALTTIAAEGNASLNVVAGPMGEALVATAIGLFAAIPAVLAYNAFVRMNRVLIQDLRHSAEQITLYLSLSPAGENIRFMKKAN